MKTMKEKHKCIWCDANLDLNKCYGSTKTTGGIQCPKCKGLISWNSKVAMGAPWRTLLAVKTKALRLRLYFEPRDAFVGIFWDSRPSGFNLWLVVIPMFPLQVVLPWIKYE